MKTLITSVNRFALLLAICIWIPAASAFYDPSVQKWVNRDPIAEEGGFNLYGCVGNSPENKVDPWGFGYDENRPPCLTFSGALVYGPPNPGTINPVGQYVLPEKENPTGGGNILFSASAGLFIGVGGEAGIQSINLENGENVGYLYIGGGVGFGGKGVALQQGEVGGVFHPSDYAGRFRSIGGGAFAGGTAAVNPNETAYSLTGGFMMPGASATEQYYFRLW